MSKEKSIVGSIKQLTTQPGVSVAPIIMPLPVAVPVVAANKDTIVALIYLLYKTHIISNNNLTQMLTVIEKPWPEDMMAYLVAEAKKWK